ncbi:aminotransferase [Streptomyces sp. 11-1-2]|nr:aminotransferase [Streptomyces sp. 11-1-2]
MDVERGSQHVTVTIDGRVVAESTRPLLVHETGLPVRYYLPPEDVDLTLFQPTDSHTICPFKGEAAYWTYRGAAGDEAEPRPDVVWAYPQPIEKVAQIKDHLSFYDAVAKIDVSE